MAKLRHPHNRLDKTEEPGNGVAEVGGEVASVGTEEEGGGGEQEEESKDHPTEDLTNR